MSAAKFLHKKAGYTELMNWEKIPSMPEIESEWYAYAFKMKNASFAYADSKKTGKKYDCFACSKKELQYLSKYVKYLMRYNNSSNYAVGVIRLAYDTHQGLTKK